MVEVGSRVFKGVIGDIHRALGEDKFQEMVARLTKAVEEMKPCQVYMVNNVLIRYMETDGDYIVGYIPYLGGREVRIHKSDIYYCRKEF